MKTKLNWRTDRPESAGQYLAVILVEGERIVMEAGYYHHQDKWMVEIPQTYDPHWEELPGKMLCWSELDFTGLEEFIENSK